MKYSDDTRDGLDVKTQMNVESMYGSRSLIEQMAMRFMDASHDRDDVAGAICGQERGHTLT